MTFANFNEKETEGQKNRKDACVSRARDTSSWCNKEETCIAATMQQCRNNDNEKDLWTLFKTQR